MLKNYSPFTLPRISETGYKALKDLRAEGKSTLIKRQKCAGGYILEVTPSVQIVLWRDEDNRKLFEAEVVHKSERCFKLRRSNLTEAIKEGASSLLSFFRFVKAMDYTVIHEILYQPGRTE